MATKRERNGKFQYIVKNKKLLPKPITLTFESEADGDAYIAELESLLSQGIVPIEFQSGDKAKKLHELINEYIRTVAITDDRRQLLELAKKRIQNVELSTITYRWAESWVTEMKRVRKLVPGTITKHVGALSGCLDWAVNHQYLALNPLKNLPKGYSTYSPEDVKVAGEYIENNERDRRFEPGEEDQILKVIEGTYKPEHRQRALKPEPALAYRTFFLLALETAMRMRELYTLEVSQVKFDKKTIFLEKTKNGDKRQVPMTTVTLDLLQDYINSRELDKYLFPEFFDGKYTQQALRRNTSRNSRQWARVFDHAGCPDFNFHDIRHEATSRFYEHTRLSDLLIAKITGHKTLSMLKRYANLRGSDLADELW